MTTPIAAVDLGATSGRVIRGVVSEESFHYETVHRFPNGPVEHGGSLHWDVSGLYREVLTGLSKMGSDEVASVGVDSWAVDYGLMAGGTLLWEPHHYRDARCERGVAAVHEKMPFDDLFAANGLQFLTFNTVYQLAAEDWSGAAATAESLLLVPDLMGFWLSGVAVTELTNASTTGLLELGKDAWSDDLIALSGAPRHLFGTLVEPGTLLGAVAGEAASALPRASVITVGSHDTASAVAATPLRDERSAYISLGTWGLVGMEVPTPIVTAEARASNFTNERAIDGQVRFLRNVMGLWMVNECVSAWQERDPSLRLEDVVEQAGQLDLPTHLIDVDDPVFAPPGDMPSRVIQWLRDRDLAVPDSPAGLVNVILSSLATAYVDTVRDAGRLAGTEIAEINVVGGGSQNAVLCQRIADLAGVDVVAGPVEATAIGNLMVQARALGLISGDQGVVRRMVERTSSLVRYSPRRSGR